VRFLFASQPKKIAPSCDYSAMFGAGCDQLHGFAVQKFDLAKLENYFVFIFPDEQAELIDVSELKPSGERKFDHVLLRLIPRSFQHGVSPTSKEYQASRVSLPRYWLYKRYRIRTASSLTNVDEFPRNLQVNAGYDNADQAAVNFASLMPRVLILDWRGRRRWPDSQRRQLKEPRWAFAPESQYAPEISKGCQETSYWRFGLAVTCHNTFL
jgi:hypothetical protein